MAVTPNGVSIRDYKFTNGCTFNYETMNQICEALNNVRAAVNGSGITIDETTNEISVNVGPGLTFSGDTNVLTINYDNGLTIDDEGKISATYQVSVTYDELLNLVRTSGLTPGYVYRMTDFVTTVANDETAISDEHPFDLLLTADSESVINENVKFIQHPYNDMLKDPSTDPSYYFHKCNLSAWQGKYCLTNDTSRFFWADNTVNEIYAGNLWFAYHSATTINDTTYYLWYNAEYTDDTDGTNGYIVTTKEKGFSVGDTVSSAKLETVNGVQTVTITKENSLTIQMDNETLLFVKENGKGVIYRLIDEYNNDCPYDFKNIRFARWGVSSVTVNGLNTTAITNFNKLITYNSETQPIKYLYKPQNWANFNNDNLTYHTVKLLYDNEIPHYYYTFTWIAEDRTIQDASVEWQNLTKVTNKVSFGVYENKIETTTKNTIYDHQSTYGDYVRGDQKYTSSDNSSFYLNNVVFVSSYYSEDGGFWGYYGNKLGPQSYCNTFGTSTFRNIFMGGCYGNIFGGTFCYNTVGHEFSQNFGYTVTENTFGTMCYRNTFGRNFNLNSIGDGVHDCNFAEYCCYNYFAPYVYSIELNDNYIQNSTFETGIYGLRISGYTTSSDMPLKNIKILEGVSGEKSRTAIKPVEITGLSVNKKYTQTVGYEVREVDITEEQVDKEGNKTTEVVGTEEQLTITIKKGLNVLNL